ncbi:MAG: type-F conjugative transfer system protein TraW [Gallionella sp.]
MFKKALIGILCASACASVPVMGGSLGTYGKVWEIQEVDIVSLLEQRAAAYEKSGQAEAVKKKAQAIVRQRVENPKPVSSIKTATKGRRYYFDPSFVTQKTITDHRGNIIVPAGLTVNPLKTLPLSKPLIFIDARDKRQVEWAENFIANEPRTKLILVAGPVLKLQRKYHHRVYFDQTGRIVHKLNIEQVPAVVRQHKGMEVLEIEEIVL